MVWWSCELGVWDSPMTEILFHVFLSSHFGRDVLGMINLLTCHVLRAKLINKNKQPPSCPKRFRDAKPGRPSL